MSTGIVPLKNNISKVRLMLKWVMVCLAVSLTAAVFGFGGIAEGASEAAKAIFFIFLVLFSLSLVIRLVRGR